MFFDSTEIPTARITTSTMSEEQVFKMDTQKPVTRSEARRRRASGDLGSPETRQRKAVCKGQIDMDGYNWPEATSHRPSWRR